MIKELRNRGNIVYLADYFENPPAKQYADKHFQISTLDENAVYELAKKEQVDLITTACTDQALMTVASVSEKATFTVLHIFEKLQEMLLIRRT